MVDTSNVEGLSLLLELAGLSTVHRGSDSITDSGFSLNGNSTCSLSGSELSTGGSSRSASASLCENNGSPVLL